MVVNYWTARLKESSVAIWRLVEEHYLPQIGIPGVLLRELGSELTKSIICIAAARGMFKLSKRRKIFEAELYFLVDFFDLTHPLD